MLIVPILRNLALEKGRQTMAHGPNLAPQPVFVSNFSLEHSRDHLFTCCLCLLLSNSARVEKLWQRHIAHKPKVFIILSFTEKSLITEGDLWTNIIIIITSSPSPSVGNLLEMLILETNPILTDWKFLAMRPNNLYFNKSSKWFSYISQIPKYTYMASERLTCCS